MKRFLFALLVVLVFPVNAQAGCLFHSRGAVMHSPGIVMGSPAMAGPAIMPAPVPLPAIAPPPGTVGQTYSRVSHPIPEDEHPRSAMLAVRDQDAVKFLKVQRMGGFRMKSDIWLFEASRPLFPGEDQIVRVEARHDKADIQPYKVKFVRLIPGRIVYLDF